MSGQEWDPCRRFVGAHGLAIIQNFTCLFPYPTASSAQVPCAHAGKWVPQQWLCSSSATLRARCLALRKLHSTNSRFGAFSIARIAILRYTRISIYLLRLVDNDRRVYLLFK